MTGWRKRQVLEMARQAGFDTDLPVFKDGTAIALKLANLVASAEREAIIDLVAMYGGTVDLEAAIRNRGQA